MMILSHFLYVQRIIGENGLGWTQKFISEVSALMTSHAVGLHE
jgi:hypothetical protein